MHGSMVLYRYCMLFFSPPLRKKQIKRNEKEEQLKKEKKQG
jgi:hypothetical protein